MVASLKIKTKIYLIESLRFTVYSLPPTVALGFAAYSNRRSSERLKSLLLTAYGLRVKRVARLCRLFELASLKNYRVIGRELFVNDYSGVSCHKYLGTICPYVGIQLWLSLAHLL